MEPAAVWAEYPRPQLQRKNWTNLNGLWSHAIAEKGEADAGVMENLEGGGNQEAAARSLLLVPFCAESALSGVGRLIESDQALWYRRELPVKPVAGERTLLHFGAVDYEAVVWVNGKEVGRHVGGFTPFSFDITAALTDAKNRVVVRVHDATEGWQLRGKQALKPQGITYTRVTGIWQTVWLEQVPERFVADLDFETMVKPGTGEQTQGGQGKSGSETRGPGLGLKFPPLRACGGGRGVARVSPHGHFSIEDDITRSRLLPAHPVRVIIDGIGQPGRTDGRGKECENRQRADR